MVHLQTINPFLVTYYYMLSYDMDYNSNGEWTTVKEYNVPLWNVLKYKQVPPISKFRILFLIHFTMALYDMVFFKSVMWISGQK